jgi:hypothetical protein
MYTGEEPLCVKAWQGESLNLCCHGNVTLPGLSPYVTRDSRLMTRDLDSSNVTLDS